MKLILFFILAANLIGPTLVHAQAPQSGPRFNSEVDANLTIRRVGVLPVTDNTEGVYARPIEDRLKELLKHNHQWDLVDTPVVGNIMNTSELEEDPATIQKLAQSFHVDAIIAARAQRSPSGVSIVIDLFLANDGRLFLQETLRDHPRFETAEIQKRAQEMLQKIIDRMPYRGIVLSRTNTKVTVNLGTRDGIKKDQVLNAIVILGIQRHPKYNFMVSSEKEIIGRIRVEKVDETLFLGSLLSEKERGAVQKGTKILGVDEVVYSDMPSATGDSRDNQQANQLAFGEKPTEWLPTTPPAFGRVGFKLGLGSFIANTKLDPDTNLSGQASLFPNLSLLGELWITPEWILRTTIQQGVASITNPLPGSQPDSLNLSMSRYSLHLGYNFLLKNDFFGPKVQVLGGFSQSSVFVDASAPLSLTSTTYSGLSLGVNAIFPLPISKEKDKYDLGVALFLFIKPHLSETPQTSGASSESSINQFSIFGSMKMGERLRGVSSLDIDLYSTTYSGGGTRSTNAQNSSQRITTFNGGLEYSF